jgi:hypothetical protein
VKGGDVMTKVSARREGKMVYRIAEWCDETLVDSRLWSLVVAVADRLQSIEDRLDGSEVKAVMDAAALKAGVKVGSWPIENLSRTWRRRFERKWINERVGKTA